MIYSFNELYCKFETANFRTDSRTTGNTGFALGVVTCNLVTLCFYSISVLFDSSVLGNQPERKVRKRCLYDQEKTEQIFKIVKKVED